MAKMVLEELLTATLGMSGPQVLALKLGAMVVADVLKRPQTVLGGDSSVLSSTPGRVRIAAEGLKGSARLARRIEERVGQLPGVEKVEAAARANGVTSLEWLSASEAQRLEPELRCVAALLSPATGIIDSHALMLAYQGDAEAAGAVIAFRAPVVSGRVLADGFELAVGGEEPAAIRCRMLVNAAGLYAPALARTIDGIPPGSIPPPISAVAFISR